MRCAHADVPAVLCLFSHWCLHISPLLWETLVPAGVQPLLQVQAVEALDHSSGHILADANGSVQVTEFPQDRYYLPTVYFSSFGKLTHSLKFIFFPGKMLQDEKQSYLPCVTPQTLSFGFAEKKPSASLPPFLSDI